MSTSAPPASGRSTQDSPAEAAAATRPSQGITQPSAIKEEPIAEGKSQLTEGKSSGTGAGKGLTEGSRPVTEGNKALTEEKKGASTVTPQGATGAASGTNASATTGAEKRGASATQPSGAAAQPAGAAKKQSGNAACVSVCVRCYCVLHSAGSVQVAEFAGHLYVYDMTHTLQQCILLCDLYHFGEYGSFTLLYASSQSPRQQLLPLTAVHLQHMSEVSHACLQCRHCWLLCMLWWTVIQGVITASHI